ncbi:MAG: PKD domain-containing protein [Halobacteriota archaeon]
MNKKKGIKKGITGITLAAIMIASVFAMIIPSVMAPSALSYFSTSKETLDATGTYVDPTMNYSVGDTVHYTVNYTNTDPNYNCTLDLWDILPNGTKVDFAADAFFLSGETKTCTVDYVVEAANVQDPDGGTPYKHIINTAHADGINERNERIIDQRMKISEILEEYDPVFSFDFDHACCKNMSFTGTANDPDGNVVNWSWYFGEDAEEDANGGDPRYHNGTGGTVEATWCVFDNCGDHTVRLSGYDDHGNYGFTEETVDVPCPPIADADANPSWVYSGDGTVVEFDGNASTADAGLSLSYHWEFWDGTTNDTATVYKAVDGDPGDVVCAELTVNDGHCEDNETVCVPIREKTNCTLRVYGYLNRGAGAPGVVDVETNRHPENPPYTDPEAPFYPQAGESPRKDFITFDPIIMSHKNLDWDNTDPADHNDDNEQYGFYVYRQLIRNDGKDGSEKIFKRMWYEPTEWYKDEDRDSELDFVLIRGEERKCWVNESELHDYLVDGWMIKPSNSDDSCGDIYAPSIKQEFTYMMLDASADKPQPLAAPTGTSTMMIPMASWIPDNGIDSFDADGDVKKKPDAVRIESEESLEMDIDNDGGVYEPLDPTPDEPLSGDESLVLTAEKLGLTEGDELQFFDHKIVVKEVYGDHVVLRIYYQGETSPPGQLTDEKSFAEGETKFFAHGFENTYGDAEGVQGPFFVQATVIDSVENRVDIVVGRMFGNTYANIGANKYWDQKQFYVDGVCYNVVAIMTNGSDRLLYVTFRQKLPKVAVQIPNHSEDLVGWAPGVVLPEMSQYNMPHTIAVDVQDTWTDEKIGDGLRMPPLEIEYLEETIEPRFHGELKEIYNESHGWVIEWFQTIPFAYTLFKLPPAVEDAVTGVRGGNYLVTSAFRAPEGWGVLWDEGEIIEGPWFDQRLKFWYEDCTGPYFIERDGTLRIYGYLNKGAGDRTVFDPDVDGEALPENPPYTDPEAPFRNWGDEIPTKDFVIFDPVIMSHKDLDWDNNGILDIDEYEFYVYRQLIRNDGKDASEKIFKRMWYEPIEVYKDEHWAKSVGSPGPDVLLNTGECVQLAAFDNPVFFMDNWDKIVPFNDNAEICDIYAPSIKQEFTYMMLDSSADAPMPKAAPVRTSTMMIPMASWVEGNGIDSFDADNDGVPDAVHIESEVSLGVDFDFDGDGSVLEPLDPTPLDPLSGDESLILTLDSKTMTLGDKLQFFDHMIVLDDLYGDAATFIVYYTGESSEMPEVIREVSLMAGEKAYFDDRDMNWETGDAEVQRGPFCIEVSIVDSGVDKKARVKVSRMFGNTYANIGAHDDEDWYWNQKQFYVDGVCYNVVAIMTDGSDSLLYVTFRQKLPKEDVYIPNHSLELPGWDAWDVLPEMPQYNMNHTLVLDVQEEWTVPEEMADKLGPTIDAQALEVVYVSETDEPRFHGELKQIYDDESGGWKIEWYQTIPYQYTGFKLPVIEEEIYQGTTLKSRYLVTSAFWAPEACYHYWDGAENDESPWCDEGGRLKFWFDPQDPTDIYVNPPPEVVELNITQWYDLREHGGNGNGEVDLPELRNAILDYIHAFGNGDYPFGPNGIFDRGDLGEMMEAYIDAYVLD